MKNNFDGHDNHHHNNIYAYVGHEFEINDQLPGHKDMTSNRDYRLGSCSVPGMTVVYDNNRKSTRV